MLELFKIHDLDGVDLCVLCNMDAVHEDDERHVVEVDVGADFDVECVDVIIDLGALVLLLSFPVGY